MTAAEAKQKLVAAARAELGYRESGNNWTKYAEEPMIERLYGWKPQNQPWCCTFVNWVFLTTFGWEIGSKLTYGGTAACANSAQLFRSAGAYSYSPRVGDQAFFFSGGGGINHTGIVVSVEGSDYITVEGNYSDKVSQVRHSTGGSETAGFGRPKWELADGVKDSIHSGTGSETECKNDDEDFNSGDHGLKLSHVQYSNKYSDDVVLLQALLNKRHFACGSADGFFGAKTQAAVTKAQRYFGIETDGICGPQTWEKLLER